MQLEQILNDLDREIVRLQQARSLLAGTDGKTIHSSPRYGKRKPGRPAGSGKLSPAARKRIGEAMKRSWAMRKKKLATKGGK